MRKNVGVSDSRAANHGHCTFSKHKLAIGTTKFAKTNETEGETYRKKIRTVETHELRKWLGISVVGRK